MSDTPSKTAVIILSDPKGGGEEALGRCFNGLAAAYDAKTNQESVTILFQGAGTRWPATLSQADHPGHGLYEQVRDTVAGVSCGCADVFDATEDAQAAGMDLITDNAVPGTTGLPSLRQLNRDGYRVLTF